MSKRPRSWLEGASRAVAALGLAAATGASFQHRESWGAGLDAARSVAVSFAGSPDLAVIDTETGETIAQLRASRGARDLAMDSSGEHLIVAVSSAIESLGVRADTGRRSLPLSGATRLAADARGRLYSARSRPTGVVAYASPLVDPPLWTAALPGRVRALALAPDGEMLAAGHGRQNGIVSWLLTGTGSVQQTLSLGPPLAALAFSRHGRALHVLRRNGLLTTIDAAGGSRGVPAYVARRPRAMAVAPDSSVYVLDAGAKAVIEIDPVTAEVRHTLALPKRPYDMALSPDGARLAVSSPAARSVFVIDPSRREIIRTNRFPRPPRRVVFAPAGTGGPLSTPAATTSASPATSPTPAVTATPPMGGGGQATPTGTAALPGGAVALGEVFDDGSALPLADVVVRTSSGGVERTDTDGRYIVPADRVVELTRGGYTRALRRSEPLHGPAVRLLDARLTPLAPALLLDPDGGVVGTPCSRPDGVHCVIELIVPPGRVPETATVRLTPISPQGLIAPLPLGWNVLLGLDLQASPPLAGEARLRVPLAVISAERSASIVAAFWDEDGRQWRMGPAPSIGEDTLELTLDGRVTQIALAMADTVPAAPPASAEGAPLRGVVPLPADAHAALVVANPSLIVAGTAASAAVRIEVRTLAPAPSGTRLQVRLRESYDLRDGRQLAGQTSQQDLLGYQSATGGSLGAAFTLQPSRAFGYAELARGQVAIESSLAAGEEVLSVVDAAGGQVNTPAGLQLVVPPGAVSEATAISLHPVSPADLPGGVGSRADLIAAFDSEATGAALDPLALYRLGFGTSLLDGERFVIAHVAAVDGQAVLALVALGHAEGDLVRIDACPLSQIACLSGFNGIGTYAVFTLPDDVALVTGTVSDEAGPRSGIAVRASGLPVVSVTDDHGRYLIPLPPGQTSTLRAEDRSRDLAATATVAPAPGAIISADLALLPTRPEVVDVTPPTHGSRVATDAAISLRFSEPIDGASITDTSAQLQQVLKTGAVEVPVRASLDADGMRLLLTPSAPLAAGALYRIVLSDAIRDRFANRLVPFASDFTTGQVFKAAALPPNTLRTSLPDDRGYVLVCGGPQLAQPGTFVTILNDTSGTTFTAVATGDDGTSGSEFCDARFENRCDTSQPGSFCAAIEAEFGDQVLVQVEDALHHVITLDAGPMRDEVTGTTIIGPEGGTVFAAADARYQLSVPEGAFDLVTLVTVSPVDPGALPTTADATMELIGAARLDFGGRRPLLQLDLSVPAPLDASAADQYLALQVIDFRGTDELTAVDTAFLDMANGLVTTDPGPFEGIRTQGLFGIARTRECTAYVTGFVSIGEQFETAYLPGAMHLPFPILTTTPTRYTIPVPCDRSVALELKSLADDLLDSVSHPTIPRKGEFVFLEQRLSDDTTPPQVIETQLPIPAEARDVEHDAVVSVPFSEPILSASIEGHARVLCTIGGAEVPLVGAWSQSADGKRLFFVARDGQPPRSLPFGTHCTVRIEGLSDQHGNMMPAPFATSFTTFEPAVRRRVSDVDAVAVAAIGWHRAANGPTGSRQQFMAFAEGDAHRLDALGGILLQEVGTPPASAAQFTHATAGFDYAIRFVPAEELTDAADNRFQGPYLMSVDGPGSRDSRRRFGVWRLLDLADLAHVQQLVARFVNHSSDSFDLFTSIDPAQDPGTFHFLRQIPNDLGLPLGLASFGVGHAYIANAPHIGIERLEVNGIDRDPMVQGVDGILRGHFRSVATLGSAVIAGRTDGLVVTDAGLARNPRMADYAVTGSLALILPLPAWPVDRNHDGKVAEDERVDLVVVGCDDNGRPALCVVGFDREDFQLSPGVLEGKLLLPPGSQPFRAAADPDRQLVYLANGTLGVTVLDFRDPSGSVDDSPRDGVDDRVLGSVALAGDLGGAAVARDIATDIDEQARVIGYVAAHEAGWYQVDLGPARMDVRIEGIPPGQVFDGSNRVRVEEVRYFNEKQSTFYEPVVQLPGRLADLYPDTVDVTITAFDARGTPVQPPADAEGRRLPGFGEPSITLALARVPHTNRYSLNRDGNRTKALLVSNLPVTEIELITAASGAGPACSPQTCFVVYGGLGGMLRLQASVLPLAPQFAGRERDVPIEKVGVILLGIDGLRQEVLYPPGQDDVQEADVSDRLPLDVDHTPGFGPIMGGILRPDGRRDIDGHSLRLRGASAIFPSITLASWASVLSGKPPSETGELGNEFFDRSATDKPGVPAKRQPPNGMVTYSNGAFPGYDTYGVSEKADWDFVPPNRPHPFVAPQNQRWQSKSLFENLKALPGYSEHFGPVVVAGAHYAKGADVWLTTTPSKAKFVLAAGPWRAIDCGLQDNGPDCGKVADRNFTSELLGYLDEHRAAWLAGRERFPGLIVLYQMGPDHVAHEKGLGAEYRNYLANVTGGETLAQLREKLIEIEQYYNKIFIITTDHGHTETGATGSREDWTKDNWQSGGPPVDSENRNMHLAEFATATNLIADTLEVPRFRVLSPLEPDPSTADLVVAFNGPVAHVYVRRAATGGEVSDSTWSAEPCQADRDIVANGLIAALGGSPAAFATSPNLNADAAEAAEGRPLRNLGSAIDLVLVRKGSSYVVRRPQPQETPTPASVPTPTSEDHTCIGRVTPPSTIQEFSLAEFFRDGNGRGYVDGVNRVAGLNHSTRAGDVILVLRSGTDDPPHQRHVSSSNIPSWHGSLNRSDSYVPFVVSHPGGNAQSLKSLVAFGGVCGDAERCDSTLRISPLVREVIQSQMELRANQ